MVVGAHCSLAWLSSRVTAPTRCHRRLELDFASAHETYALLDPDHDTVKADDDTLCGLLSP